MVAKEINSFSPDYAIHPGEILEETLKARNIKKSDFAIRCGLSNKTISFIINNKAPISPDTAIQFEKVLGVSAAVWLNLYANYSLFEARKAEIKELQKGIAWSKEFPINELSQRGYIEKSRDRIENVKSIFKFFGVGSVDAWRKKYEPLQVAYRKSPSFKSSYQSVLTWLRIGELESENIDCNPYNEKAFKKALREIRGKTTENAGIFEPFMVEKCALSGVAVVFVPEFPKTHLGGATFWINKDKAIIILSLRHKSDDHFWFSFFHEAGHILFHEKKVVFIDEKGGLFAFDNNQEDQANKFASDFLIPNDEYSEFVRAFDNSKQHVNEFAREQGIAPGIIVGRLQHDEYIPYTWFNSLKKKIVFRAML